METIGIKTKIKFNIVVVIILVLIDQLIKFQVYLGLKEVGSLSIIRGILNLTYVENTGAAFGIRE